MSEEISSPPYPKDSAVVSQLLIQLAELREWVLSYQEWATMTISDLGSSFNLNYDKIPVIPSLETYQQHISLIDIFQAYGATRSLRESWDHTVRFYEDEWSSKGAVVSRLRCLHMAINILENAFLTSEVKEARHLQKQNEQRDMMKQAIKKMGLPSDMPVMMFDSSGNPLSDTAEGSEETHTDEFYNNLFHGTDDTPAEPEAPEAPEADSNNPQTD